MASYNQETLERVLQQIQGTRIEAAKSLQQVRAQVAAKERERRLNELTIKELSSLQEVDGLATYRGVGKMFLLEPLSDLVAELQGDKREAESDLKSLTVKQKYYERELEKAQSHMRDLLGPAQT